MNDKPDMAQRIGTALNELDIDFSRLSPVGWLVSLLSMSLGGGAAYLAGAALMTRNGLNAAAGLTFCVTLIAVTTSGFLISRWAVGLAGYTVTRPKRRSEADVQDHASRETLERMARAGMDMTIPHPIDFWHHFETKESAARMGRKARQMSFNVVSIHHDEESAGYDVQIQVNLIPALSTIHATEQTLGAIAKRFNGRPDGWGVRQHR